MDLEVELIGNVCQCQSLDMPQEQLHDVQVNWCSVHHPIYGRFFSSRLSWSWERTSLWSPRTLHLQAQNFRKYWKFGVLLMIIIWYESPSKRTETQPWILDPLVPVYQLENCQQASKCCRWKACHSISFMKVLSRLPEESSAAEWQSHQHAFQRLQNRSWMML